MKPHKHCEVIKAWAEGAIIQCRHREDEPWEDYEEGVRPGWSDNWFYRVKPDTVRYRVALFNSADGPITRTANSDEEMYHFHGFGDFDR